jgi:uncharacterized protein (TIGR00297 family)
MNILASSISEVSSHPAPNWALAAAVTLLFAAFARLLHGVTTSGAVGGAVVCYALMMGGGWGGFAALCVVFALTWIATRVGYARKQGLGTAESRQGRDARQVLANLAIAAACALLSRLLHSRALLVGMAAALAEAAGDTVESEIGQAVGGEPLLVTNWRRVPAGTDGAITVVGTLAGSVAATSVSLACLATGTIRGRGAAVCIMSGILATFFDSALGATLERKRVLGNNGVNFLSTLLAAVIALSVA